MKFREFLRRVIPNSRSFQQINTSENDGFDQTLEDSDFLVPNIELLVIESRVQSESRNANDGVNFNPTDSSTIFNGLAPRGDSDFSVYNSPNVEIPENVSDSERLNFHRDENRSRESDPLGRQLPNQDHALRLSSSTFKNKFFKCFFNRIALGLVLAIMAIIALIIFTIIQVHVRTKHLPLDKPQPSKTQEYSDSKLGFALLPDINSLTNAENEHSYKIPKDLDWRLYTMDNMTNSTSSQGDTNENAQTEDITTPKPPLMPLPINTLTQKWVPEVFIRKSIADLEKKLKFNESETKILPMKSEKYNTNISGNHNDYRSNDTGSGVTAQELALAEDGYVMQETYRGVVDRMNLTKTEASQGLILLNGTVPASWCLPSSPPKCNITEAYRSLDGSCNNIQHVHWGAANLPYRRILFPAYDDGISSPRTLGTNDIPLPSTRKVSRDVFIDAVREDEEASLMLPIWINFIYNDLIYTASSTATTIKNEKEYGSGDLCCSQIGHPDCFPIMLSSDDPFHFLHNQSCMSFLRSAPNEDCHLGPREQYNEMSSYLDASNIYGSSLSRSESLRLKVFGRLKSYHSKSGQQFLPILEERDDICNHHQFNKDNSTEKYCFIAGDRRVNEDTTLISIHTIWLRQHNQISENLNILNPQWNDEKLFQETRRIISAQIQHITYNELLPELLPPELLTRSGLKLGTEKYYTDYDVHVDPTVSNVFGTILRFGNSMLKGTLRMVGGFQHNDETYVQIQKLFQNPFFIWEEGAMDRLIRGVTSQPAAKVDTFLSEQLTNHVQNDGKMIDLIATDIQRSRDHGLQPYLEWRKICKLPVVSNFNELHESWETDALGRISKSYKVIQDVDLYTGMLAEKPIPGGKVGPTLACILVDQFVRLKKGDRFWYEGDIQIESFSLEQLQSIRSTTLAKVLCENGDDIKNMQWRVMEKPSPRNPVVMCSKIEQFDYEPWKERNNLHMVHDSLEDSLEAKDTTVNNFTLFPKDRSQKHGILIPLQSSSGLNAPQNRSMQLVQFDNLLLNNKTHLTNKTSNHTHDSRL